MPEEKVMQFIQNIENLKKSKGGANVFEYEVIADAPVLGECEYGPYYFTIWEFLLDYEKTVGKKRKLCLRITEPGKQAFPYDEEEKPLKEKKVEFYHGGGIEDELVVLASLFLRRRLRLGRIVRMDDKPRLLPDTGSRIDDSLISGSSGLNSLPDWFNKVEKLNKKYHLRFILAARLYHQALLQIENFPEQAYLNLVSSIETLSKDYDIGKISLQELDENLSTLVNSIDNKELGKKIEEAILNRERKIGRRFVKFIIDHTTDEFWKDTGRPEMGRIDLKELPALLTKIYEQRSSTLHMGEPFPPPIYSAPIRGSEICPAQSVERSGRKWENKDFIPYPHFFERLVNHVLKNFLMKNQTK